MYYIDQVLSINPYFGDFNWQNDCQLEQPKLLGPENQKPQCPAGLYEENETGIIASWEAIDGAEFYVLQYAVSSDFSGPSFKGVRIEAPETTYHFTKDDIRYGETIYWRVWAYSSSGCASVKSESWSFEYTCAGSPNPDNNNDGQGGNDPGSDANLCEKYKVKIEVEGPERMNCCDLEDYFAKVAYSCKDALGNDTLALISANWEIKEDPGGAGKIVQFAFGDMLTISTDCHVTQRLTIIYSVVLREIATLREFTCKEAKRVVINCETKIKDKPWMQVSEYAAALHNVHPDYTDIWHIDFFANDSKDSTYFLDPIEEAATDTKRAIAVGPVFQVQEIQTPNPWTVQTDCCFPSFQSEYLYHDILEAHVHVPLGCGLYNHEGKVSFNPAEVAGTGMIGKNCKLHAYGGGFPYELGCGLVSYNDRLFSREILGSGFVAADFSTDEFNSTRDGNPQQQCLIFDLYTGCGLALEDRTWTTPLGNTWPLRQLVLDLDNVVGEGLVAKNCKIHNYGGPIPGCGLETYQDSLFTKTHFDFSETLFARGFEPVDPDVFTTFIEYGQQIECMDIQPYLDCSLRFNPIDAEFSPGITTNMFQLGINFDNVAGAGLSYDGCEMYVNYGCGLLVRDNTLYVDLKSIAGRGLTTDGCKLIAEYPGAGSFYFPYDPGCGIRLTPSTISVDTEDLTMIGLLPIAEGCGLLVYAGCGLKFGNHFELEVQAQDLAGKGLTATPQYCGLNVNYGCGITLSGDQLIVKSSDLAGSGLGTTGACEMYVKTGCGLKLDDGFVVVNPLEIIGPGLSQYGSCGLQVNYDCGLHMVGDALSFYSPDAAGTGLRSQGNCKLAVDYGCGITFAGGQLTLDVATIAGSGLGAVGPCSLKVNTGCGLEIVADAVKVNPDDLIGLGLMPEGSCGMAVYAGCGLTVGAKGVKFDNAKVASRGLVAYEDCQLRVSVGCGLGLLGSIYVDNDALAGPGLEPWGECGLRVTAAATQTYAGCGLDLYEGYFSVRPFDIAGDGLEPDPDSDCGLRALLGCGLRFDDSDPTEVPDPDNPLNTKELLPIAVNPTDLAGQGLEASGSGCGLAVKIGCGLTFDNDDAIALNIGYTDTIPSCALPVVAVRLGGTGCNIQWYVDLSGLCGGAADQISVLAMYQGCITCIPTGYCGTCE